MGQAKPFASEDADFTKPLVILLPPDHWLLKLPPEALAQLAADVEILVAPVVWEDVR